MMIYIDDLKYTYRNAWFKAISYGDVETIYYLLNHGMDINIRSEEDTTGLTRSIVDCQIEVFKILINHPFIEPNSYHEKFGWTSILNASTSIDVDIKLQIFMIKSLLKHPKIDITIKSIYGDDFIDMFEKCRSYDLNFLKDYSLQKTIIKNNQENIIIFQNHGLVNDKIKEEYYDLFKANEWGLIL